MADQPLNYHRYDDRLASSGQPSRGELFAIADDGYEVVINLAPHDGHNAIDDEGSICASLGMAYINIPVPFDEPTIEHLRQFVGIMEAFGDQQVWIHCEVNARASAFMYQYLTQVKSWKPPQATSGLLVRWQTNMDPIWGEFLQLQLSV